MEERQHKLFKDRFLGDRVILILVLLFTITSALMVYSTEGHRVLRHIFYILGCYVTLFVFYNIDYRKIGIFSSLGILFAGVLLTLSLFSQAVRGVVIGGHSFQTFYLIGFLVIMYLSMKIAKIKQEDRTPTGRETLAIFLVMLIFCAGIAALNMSTAIILFATGLVICYVGGVRFRYLAAFLGVMVLVVGLLSCVVIVKMKDGEMSNIGRMDTFVKRLEFYFTSDNSENYGDQMVLSRAAIARSGFRPAGPGKGVIKYRLPENSTDYAFASIVEETGVYVGIPLIFFYLAFFYRAREIAKKASGPFGNLLAFGIGFWLTCQALVHIGVNCDLLPSTGQTLPFVSTGGASLLVSGMVTGILLNISKMNALGIKTPKSEVRFVRRED